jgi:hypothetical protein
MRYKILLNKNDDVKKVEEEEKDKFLRDFLIQVGVPIEEYWNENDVLDVKKRVKIREIITAWNIKVIDDLDSHMQVYVEDNLFAEWFKSTYKLKQDLRELDPRKRLYVEMEVNNWTIFEEQ